MRRIDVAGLAPSERPLALQRQWLVTNGLGGYASATLSGAITWRYHGLLVAALPAPYGRTVMLSHLDEVVRFPDGSAHRLAGAAEEKADAGGELIEFRLENNIPTWRYVIGEVVIEKRIVMPSRQNTVHVTYRAEPSHAGLSLELRPSVRFRGLEDSVSAADRAEYELRNRGQRFEIASTLPYPPLRLCVEAETHRFINDGGSTREIIYSLDAERGFDARGTLWSPGYFSIPLGSAPVTLIASTEEWHTVLALDPESAHATERERTARLIRMAHPKAQHGVAAELVLAADQFLMLPAGRIKDAARARAAGDELRAVIAGYHWFTDWGRDTMISLEGLTLTTGRFQEAAWILRAFAHYVRDGLIPNLFPEGRTEGLYHTADATLWFFHAVHRYVAVTGDQATLEQLLPTLRDIVRWHLLGTRFGIRVDPADGLLRQGEEGYQLTWMDAKVGDWVVTPRRGKAVEINALWHNALRLLATWLEAAGAKPEAVELSALADRAQQSFNARFWNPATGCLLDVVDGEKGDDPAVRPNQLLAIALSHPVLHPSRWASVLEVCERDLLTPVGLRSLSPRHADYKPKYTGDLRSRDAAYHQGTVWAWLIGPYIDAALKTPGADRARVRKRLEGFIPHLNEGCIGSINEIFDAEPPYTPRGCVAQAWSVAEVLRTLVLTAESESARAGPH